MQHDTILPSGNACAYNYQFGIPHEEKAILQRPVNKKANSDAIKAVIVLDCYPTAIGLLFDWYSTAFTSLKPVIKQLRFSHKQ